MQKTLSFFRVFDIAFFAPGIVLFGAIWYGHIAKCHFASQWKDDTVNTVISIMLVIAFIYVLGLLCHSIQRLMQYSLKRTHNNRSNDAASSYSPWFMGLEGSTLHEFATYFWYLRSTCWNLAIAVFVAAIISWEGLTAYWNGLTVILAVFIVSTAFLLLGFDFEKSMLKAMEKSKDTAG